MVALQAKGGALNEKLRVIQIRQLLQVCKLIIKCKTWKGGIVIDTHRKQFFLLLAIHSYIKGTPLSALLFLVLVKQRINTVTKGSSTATILCGDLNADPLSEIYSILHENFVSVYSLICPCEPPHLANELEVLEFCDAVTDGGAQAEPLFTTWKFRYLSSLKPRFETCFCISELFFVCICLRLPNESFPLAKVQLLL